MELEEELEWTAYIPIIEKVIEKRSLIYEIAFLFR